MTRFKNETGSLYSREPSFLSMICALGSISLARALWDSKLSHAPIDRENQPFINLRGIRTIDTYIYMVRKRALFRQTDTEGDVQPLLMAVEMNDKPTIEILLSKGSPSALSPASHIRYLEACGNASMVQTLLLHGAVIEDWNRCLIGYHFRRGVEGALQEMSHRERGVFLRSSDVKGQTLVHALSRRGGCLRLNQCLRVILRIDATTANLKNNLGLTPVQTAAQHENYEALEALYYVGKAKLDYSDDVAVQSLLCLSCAQGNYDQVQSMLEMGINPNVVSRGGNRALDVVLNDKLTLRQDIEKRSHYRTLDLLLQCPSIEVNYLNRDGETLLTHIINMRRYDYLRLVLKHPALDVNRLNSSGNSPLVLVLKSMRGSQKPLLNDDAFARYRSLMRNRLVCSNAPEPATAHPQLPLSIPWSVPIAVLLLLQHPSVDVNLRDSEGLTPILVAVRYAQLAVIERLWDDPRVDRLAKCNKGWGVLRLSRVEYFLTEPPTRPVSQV
ncbi:ankyrin repeat-containing domain protein [Xylariaceae sp. FL0594]|nr:ankyrin repeat-containing domain protein [Xylariaceae sp. FL0594]